MKYEGLVGIYANCSTDILWVFMYPDISLHYVLLKDRGVIYALYDDESTFTYHIHGKISECQKKNKCNEPVAPAPFGVVRGPTTDTPAKSIFLSVCGSIGEGPLLFGGVRTCSSGYSSTRDGVCPGFSSDYAGTLMLLSACESDSSPNI
ncbi:LOW QUALITY PROTEIN: hypothetical protein YC2023_048411 [Brassica napus]